MAIDRYDWKLFQDGELVDAAHGVTTGITDGICIQFTPAKALRRGRVEDLKLPKGFFYPPFGPKWAYRTLTYHNHSDFSVDFNRGNPGDDEGDWVTAPAPGKVASLDFRLPGTIDANDPGVSDLVIDHDGGFRTLYTHMKDIPHKIGVGKRVKLRQRLGRISAIGEATGSHLHHCHYEDVPFPGSRFGKPMKMKILGVEQDASVHDSNLGHQEGWKVEPLKKVRAPVLRSLFRVRVWRGTERSRWRELRFIVTKEGEPVPEWVDPGCPPAL